MSTTEPAAGTRPVPASKTLVRRLVEEGINQGRLEVVDQVLAPAVPGLIPARDGPTGVRRLLAAYREAIPDAHWDIQEQVADGGVVVTCFVASGTQRGPLWGVPATGRRMAVSGVLVSHCQDGQIVKQRLQLDLLGMLQQLGVMPELGLEEEVTVAELLRQSRRCGG